MASLLVAGLAGHVTAEAAGPKSEGMSAAEAFSQLKTLAGDWDADTQMGHAHLNIQLIAGGTSLVERETGDKMPEMMTVYYVDGDRLMLTHYCMAGNQPRMQAQSFHPETGELEFQFLDATNLTSPGAGHMHNAKIRIADHDHLVTEWQFYENGQKKMSETAQYTRVR